MTLQLITLLLLQLKNAAIPDPMIKLAFTYDKQLDNNDNNDDAIRALCRLHAVQSSR